MSLAGWVLNSSSGLVVEVEGTPDELRRFEQRIALERPKASVITTHESSWLAPQSFTKFEIHHGESDSAKSVNVLPDLIRVTWGFAPRLGATLGSFRWEYRVLAAAMATRLHRRQQTPRPKPN
jgi:hypothetical protein